MSDRTKKKKKFFPLLLLITASIALIVLSIIALTKASAFAQIITVDPALGYAPNSYVQDPHLIAWFLGTPVLWVVPLLIAIVIATSRYRNRYAILTWTFIVTGILLFFGSLNTIDKNTDTFSTWAEQRYGIEIDKPPYEGDFLLNSEKIDTTIDVVLDDGQTIGFEEYRDSRGDTAYIIVDRSSPASSHELDIIAD